MEMNVKEAKRRVESLRGLRKDLVALHGQILQLQEDSTETKATICDAPIIDAVAHLSDYEVVLLNAIDNAKISL